ncbi:uncharacterized protein LOC132312058 [Cornus florida]|uniref:uncharacterized protein LOC132312058 n=1 Tax=Cornus florida TaxID=4283 RepID=UPI00289AED2D|nr:uncharacterized protein LOC132312058 [Cornus florida]
MSNWKGFGDRLLRCRLSMLKTWGNCSNSAARFYHSTCGGGGSGKGGGFLSPVRSSEYFLRLGGRSVGALKKGATFSSIQPHFFSSCAKATTDVVVVVEEEARGPLPLQSAPWLMLPAGCGLVAEGDSGRYKLEAKDGERDYYRFFSLREKKVVKMKTNLMLPWQRELLSPDEAICFGSSRGWLAFIHSRNSSLYFFNPSIHSYLPYLPLPPIQTLPSFISSSRHNSNMHSPSYSSSSINYNDIVTEFMLWNNYSPISSQDLNKEEVFFKKIVLSSAPSPFPSNHHLHIENTNNNSNNNNTNEESTCSCDCTVMAIQGYKQYKLAFCKIGDTSWTALNGAATGYNDVIYFSKEQTFYAFSHSDEIIEAWDLSNPASPKNTSIISHLPPWVHPTMDEHQSLLRRVWDPDHYLVESSGELLMVVRYYKDGKQIKTILFDVYKLDFVNKEWLLLPSLGNRALFVGLNDSVSVSASDFPGLAMNCIYFTNPGILPEDFHDLGIFNLEDNTITPIYDYDLKIQLPSIWIVPPQQ